MKTIFEELREMNELPLKGFLEFAKPRGSEIPPDADEIDNDKVREAITKKI